MMKNHSKVWRYYFTVFSGEIWNLYGQLLSKQTQGFCVPLFMTQEKADIWASVERTTAKKMPSLMSTLQTKQFLRRIFFQLL
jgi:hypothetical protein